VLRADGGQFFRGTFMIVERKEIFEFLVTLDDSDFNKLKAISDEFGNSIADMLKWILSEQLIEYFDNL